MKRSLPESPLRLRKGALYGLLALVLLLALGLRLRANRDPVLSGDEATSILQASGHAGGIDAGLVARPLTGEEVNRHLDPSRGNPANILVGLERAGMQPPLYILLLRLLPVDPLDGILPLRLLSILFSLISVWLLYRIGCELFGPGPGLVAAASFAVAPWAVGHAGMIRPYPLAMLLALLSTFVVVRLAARRGNRRRALFAFAFLSLAGIYTLYHYIFVALAQGAVLLFLTVRRGEPVRDVLLPAGLSAILFLPWLPSFLEQFGSIEAGSLYFHGEPDLWKLGRGLLVEPFLPRTRYAGHALFRLAFPIVLLGVFLHGVVRLLAASPRRAFLAVVVLWFLLSLLGDLLSGMRTLETAKFQFLLVPCVLLLFAVGAFHLMPRRSAVGWSASGVLFLLLLANQLHLTQPERYDGPPGLAQVRDRLREEGALVPGTLVVVTTNERRHLFSFAAALGNDVDYLVWSPDRGPDPPDLGAYENIVLLAPLPEPAHEKSILDAVREQGFRTVWELRAPSGSHRVRLVLLTREGAGG